MSKRKLFYYQQKNTLCNLEIHAWHHYKEWIHGSIYVNARRCIYCDLEQIEKAGEWPKRTRKTFQAMQLKLLEES